MLHVQEDILEIFAETQERHAESIACQLFGVEGFHVDVSEAARQRGPKTGTRKAAHSLKERERKEDQIRERILAGERPKGSGPKPVRWYRIAQELGIDIGQPAITATHGDTDAYAKSA